jgi:hypothetical protein
MSLGSCANGPAKLWWLLLGLRVDFLANCGVKFLVVEGKGGGGVVACKGAAFLDPRGSSQMGTMLHPYWRSY